MKRATRHRASSSRPRRPRKRPRARHRPGASLSSSGARSRLLLLVGVITTPGFLAVDNVLNILRSAAIIGTVALGMTFVTISRQLLLAVARRDRGVRAVVFAFVLLAGGVRLPLVLTSRSWRSASSGASSREHWSAAARTRSSRRSALGPRSSAWRRCVTANRTIQTAAMSPNGSAAPAGRDPQPDVAVPAPHGRGRADPEPNAPRPTALPRRSEPRRGTRGGHSTSAPRSSRSPLRLATAAAAGI